MRFLFLVFTLIFTIVSCRKSADIKSRLQPAIDNATAFQWLAAHAFLPTAEVLRDWSNSRAGVPALLYTDSGIWFDYKTGMVCSDGLIRKGKCLMKNGFSVNGFADTCWFYAAPKDEFALMGSNRPVYFSGKLKLINYAIYDVSIEGNAEVASYAGRFAISIDGSMQLDPEGQSVRSAKFKTIWNADVKIAGEQLYQYYKVTRERGCFPCFSTGMGYSQSKSVMLDFNPFANAACDPVVKFSFGREEWLADLW
jgi:hypothetical protein